MMNLYALIRTVAGLFVSTAQLLCMPNAFLQALMIVDISETCHQKSSISTSIPFSRPM